MPSPSGKTIQPGVVDSSSLPLSPPPSNPFPPHILERAQEELEQFVSILEKKAVRVHRPDLVHWADHDGYTGAMPRDGLVLVGNTIVYCLVYESLFREIRSDESIGIVRCSSQADP